MDWILGVIAFVTGNCVGSFLNVVILRGQRGENVRGRSRCDSCRTILSTPELIPILSFLFQKERCRHCGIALSWQYPIVEFGTGLLFAAAVLLLFQKIAFGWQFVGVAAAIFLVVSAAIVIAVSDIRYHTIPNGAALLLGILGIGTTGMRFFQSNSYYNLSLDLIGALLFSAFFWGLWFVSQGRWMGFGDVKLIFATSLLLGFPASLVAFLFSFWIGSIGGILFLVIRDKRMQDHMAFGPYIILGSFAAFFYAQPFISISGLAGFL